MGLYDREYYRDESSSSWGEWIDQRGSIALICVISAVFFLQLLTIPKSNPADIQAAIKKTHEEQRAEIFDSIRRAGDLYPPAVASGEVWRIFTGFWVNDLLQVPSFLLGLLVIFFVGKNLDTIIGGKELIFVYVLSGLFVMTVVFLLKWAGKGSDGWLFNFAAPVCGMHGPVTAMLMIYALKYWHQPVRLFGQTVVPVWSVVVTLFGISMFMSLSRIDRVDVISVELLGVLAGWIYHKMGVRVSDRLSLPKRSSRRRLPNLKLVTEENREDEIPVAVEPRPSKKSNPVDEQLEAMLDRVLDKVSRSGRESLTSEEQSILLRASEVYKKKRNV